MKIKLWDKPPTAADVRGHAIDAGHYLAEEAPEATYTALREFFIE